MVHHSRLDRSYLVRSSRIKKRKMVGGAHREVTLCVSSILRMSAGANFSWSYTNTVAPANHCPYSLPHTALSQPVSAMVRCKLFSCRLCQKLAVWICPKG